MLNLSFTRTFGWVGERKALSLVSLGFYVSIFALLSFVFFMQDQPQWGRCFAALSLCYGVGFFALAAGWFWGRWFAIGLGYSGVSTAIWGMISIRYVAPPLLFYGLTHGLVALMLQGEKMAKEFDWKTEWRERFHVEEEAVVRIRKTVVRSVSSLPTMILFLLSPREEGMAFGLLLVLFGVSLLGLLKMRTWGWVGLAVVLGGVGVALLKGTHPLNWMKWNHGLPESSNDVMSILHHWNWLAGLSGAWLVGALVPFSRPMWRFQKRIK